MSQQAHLTAARILRISSTRNGESSGEPVDGFTDPDFTMSPVTPTGLQTTGFLLILKEPSNGGAQPSGTDDTFAITPWIRNPITKVWGAGETTAIGYNQVFVTGDIDAAEIYFQIGDVDVAGFVDIHFAEQ